MIHSIKSASVEQAYRVPNLQSINGSTVNNPFLDDCSGRSLN